MVKTLDSIISRVPPATVNNPAIVAEKNDIKDIQSEEPNKAKDEYEPMVRINAEVPLSIKIQIKERLFKNPGDTERTIILKALRAYGFDIDEKYLIDNRKTRNK